MCVCVSHNDSLCRDYEATPCISEIFLPFLVAMKVSRRAYIQWLHYVCLKCFLLYETRNMLQVSKK